MSGLFAGTPLEQPVTCQYCAQQTCICPRNPAGEPCPPKCQSPRVRREKRRGKWNTIIADIHASPDPGPASREGDLKPILKSLRTRLGTGGGLGEPGEIVLQGDHKDAVVKHLTGLGYKAKPAGG